MKPTAFVILLTGFAAALLPARGQAIPGKFVHPGVVFDLADLNRLKEKKAVPPWSEGYEKLAAKPQAARDYKMRGPFEVVGREPNLNRSEFESDCLDVYFQALQWTLTGDPIYAQNGVKILDAWATTHKRWSGGTPRIGVGEFGIYMVIGAEILRSTYPKWPAVSTTHAETYFKETFWPLLSLGPSGRLAGANQGAMQLQVGAAIAVFCNDRERLSEVLYSWYFDGAATPQNSLPNGEIGDTGRHQPHALIQIRGLALTAETMFKQGIDLYSQLDNRLLAVGEYFCNDNLGNDIPFIPFGCTYDFYLKPGHDRGILPWGTLPLEILTNAYVVRKKMPAPFMRRYLDAISPDENTFLFKNDVAPKTMPPPAVPPAPLPDPAAVTRILSAEIGHPKGKAKASLADGAWTLEGAGKGIGNDPADSFSFAYLPMSGDGVIIARITGLQGGTGKPGAKAGLMIRESLESNAPSRVALVLTPDRRVECTFPGGNGKRGSEIQPYIAFPWWLKLERRGNRILVYHCADGINWSIAASVPVAFGRTASAGIAVCSGSPRDLTTATFDHVRISQ